MLRQSDFIGRVITAACLICSINFASFAQSPRNAARAEERAVSFSRFKAAQKTDGKSDDNNRLKETLVDLEKKSWEAWKNHDGKYFENFLSDDHVELGFGGPSDKGLVVKVVASVKFCSVKSYSVDQFQLTQFSGNTALLIYHAAQDTTCGGKPVPSPVWVSSLYIKRGKRWLNAAYQQTQTNK